VWKMMIAQAVHTQLLPMTLNKCKMWFEKTVRLGVWAVAEEVGSCSKFKAMLFSLISRVLWWQSGFPAARQ
jgi:hypothetical protein